MQTMTAPSPATFSRELVQQLSRIATGRDAAWWVDWIRAEREKRGH
jgi:hypothetical protein